MTTSSPVEWLKKIPDGVKWLIAFVTAVIGFVVLFRQHSKLGLVVLILLALVALLSFCVYVLAARDKPRFEGAKGLYRYGKYHRRAAMAGLALPVLAGVAIFAHAPTRELFLEAFRGRALVKADVLIAGFDTQHASRTIELPRRLQADLESRLRRRGLANVTVKVLAAPVADDAEAARLADEGEAKAVIYGWYDDMGIQIRILLTDPGQEQTDRAALKEVPWDLGDDNQKLSLVMRDVLGNLSFLSMFVIGHLYYLDNRYQAGHAAFDEAMASIPSSAALENEAVLHFFSARNMQASANPDLAATVCEYAEAIRLDPKFYEAYNNLGILYGSGDFEGDPFPAEAYRCLQEAGIGREEVESLFDKALELQPSSVSAAYNKWAKLWKGSSEGEISDREIEAALERLAKQDESIPGLQLILGVIAFDKGDLAAAETRFSKVLELAPGLSGLRTNLGQVFVRRGELEKAETSFMQALREDSTDLEARLALAHLSIQKGQIDSALKHLQATLAPQPDHAHRLDPLPEVLRSRIHFARGELAQAIDLLNRRLPSFYIEELEDFSLYADLFHYLLALLHSRRGEAGEAAAHWRYEFRGVDSPQELLGDSRRQNDTLGTTWFDLLSRCEPRGAGAAPATWGERNPCLPRDLERRIGTVYQIIQENAAFRIYHRKVVFADMACPYVFTYDPQRRTWELDTTILYKLSGLAAESEQWRSLNHFDGRLLIRELEPETSYIDRLRVVVVDGHGRRVELRPELPLLQEKDGEYLILQPKEEILLRFEGFKQIAAPQRSWVVAEGYYVPREASVRP